jgi:putative nucleotidyltransferase with HDIG domain
MNTQATNYQSNTSVLLSKPKLNIELLVKVKLPPMKSTVLRLMELLRDQDVMTATLAETVRYDPILATRVLRLANSALYSLRKPVTTIQKALDAIGTRSLYDLVMLDAMADGFGTEIRNSVLIKTIWEHSVAVGLLSRELSRMLKLQGGEEAFVCGLLHDIGKILMLRADVERFESLLDQRTEHGMLEWEEKIYGFDHTEVGAYVANKWRLPDAVCSVIMHHHNPSKSPHSVVMANVVNAADLIANIHGYGLRLEEETALIISEPIALLKLSRPQINEAWENIQDAISEVTNLLK